MYQNRLANRMDIRYPPSQPVLAVHRHVPENIDRDWQYEMETRERQFKAKEKALKSRETALKRQECAYKESQEQVVALKDLVSKLESRVNTISDENNLLKQQHQILSHQVVTSSQAPANPSQNGAPIQAHASAQQLVSERPHGESECQVTASNALAGIAAQMSANLTEIALRVIDSMGPRAENSCIGKGSQSTEIPRYYETPSYYYYSSPRVPARADYNAYPSDSRQYRRGYSSRVIHDYNHGHRSGHRSGNQRPEKANKRDTAAERNISPEVTPPPSKELSIVYDLIDLSAGGDQDLGSKMITTDPPQELSHKTILQVKQPACVDSDNQSWITSESVRPKELEYNQSVCENSNIQDLLTLGLCRSNDQFDTDYPDTIPHDTAGPKDHLNSTPTPASELKKLDTMCSGEVNVAKTQSVSPGCDPDLSEQSPKPSFLEEASLLKSSP